MQKKKHNPTTTIKHLRHILIGLTLTIAITAGSIQKAAAQFYSVSVNMPLLLTGTINVAAGISLSQKFSLDLSLIGNPIKTKDFSIQMLAIQPGARYWFSQTNYAHFIGAQPMVGMYDMADKQFSYKGIYAGLGVSYGYAWVIKKRINITAEIGVGVLYTSNDQIQKNYQPNEDFFKYKNQQIVVAPTKFAVNFVYLF